VEREIGLYGAGATADGGSHELRIRPFGDTQRGHQADSCSDALGTQYAVSISPFEPCLRPGSPTPKWFASSSPTTRLRFCARCWRTSCATSPSRSTGLTVSSSRRRCARPNGRWNTWSSSCRRVTREGERADEAADDD